MRLPRVRASVLVLGALGVTMLALGIWVEDRAAVAAPLVILGALVVVAAVFVEAWADIEEMSLGQSGVTFKRRAPSVQELKEGGLPEEAAVLINEWFDDVLQALPGLVDRRVNSALAERAKAERTLLDLLAQTRSPEPPGSYGTSR